jgi:hypothetical protein
LLCEANPKGSPAKLCFLKWVACLKKSAGNINTVQKKQVGGAWLTAPILSATLAQATACAVENARAASALAGLAQATACGVRKEGVRKEGVAKKGGEPWDTCECEGTITMPKATIS